jgi:hypothetical protein
MVRNGYTWDFPLVWEVDSGKRVYGSDYYQNMMLWSVPAVMAGTDLAGPCKPGGLVDRILKAAAGRRHVHVAQGHEQWAPMIASRAVSF